VSESAVKTPRLILEVRWGKLAGMKAVIAPGSALTVGRTEIANFVIPHDGKMSGEHFVVSWDGARATLRDRGSALGTSLGGRALLEGEEAEVEHGAWIEAGETHFMVYVEGFTRAPYPEGDGTGGDEPTARERARRAAAERALAALREEARREPLYAVLDAARDDRILEVVREHAEAHRSLYDGTEGELYEEVAPYLVGPMRADSALLDKLILEGWGKRWGIFCISHDRFAEVRRHFRRFLMIELEESGDRVYFRFYDPAVLKLFWASCDARQRAEFLGKIERAHFEREGGSIEMIAADAVAGRTNELRR
jgi:hypothetical protein